MATLRAAAELSGLERLIVDDCVVTNNASQGIDDTAPGGGGIEQFRGRIVGDRQRDHSELVEKIWGRPAESWPWRQLSIQNSTIDGNVALSDGGGIFAYGGRFINGVDDDLVAIPHGAWAEELVLRATLCPSRSHFAPLWEIN